MDNKKCAAEATHEKRIAPIAATQLISINTGNRRVELAFLPRKKQAYVDGNIKLCRKFILSYAVKQSKGKFALFAAFGNDVGFGLCVELGIAEKIGTE